MKQRAITGALFLIIIVGTIIWSYWAVAGLFFVVSLIGLYEFYNLALKDESEPQRYLGVLGGALLYASLVIPQISGGSYYDFKWALLLIPINAFILIAELFRKRPRPFKNIAYTLAGWFYVVLPFALYNHFFKSVVINDTPLYVWQLGLGFFILIWTNDTFAYLVGRTIGKTKLFERMSPNKTWEGTIGGVVFTIGVAALLSYFWDVLSLVDWMVVGAIVASFGSLGDLVESMLKRSAGVKDSGRIMPGHGGILDRFDSMMLSAPMVFTYLYLTA